MKEMHVVTYRGVDIAYRLGLGVREDAFYVTRRRVTHKFGDIDAAMDYIDRWNKHEG